MTATAKETTLRLMVWQVRERWPDEPLGKWRTGSVHVLTFHARPTLLSKSLCGRWGWIDSSAITADHERSVLDESEQVCMQCVAALKRRKAAP